MKKSVNQKLIDECRRQEESCLYTSTTLYIWLREARIWRSVFIIVPIVFGAIASWSILKNFETPWTIWVTATLGLIAGLLPAIRDAIGLDVHVDEIARHAAQFKNLQDCFRLAANVGIDKEPDDFEIQVKDLLERLDDTRKASVTPPERCFKKAKAKIKSGDYDFSVDEK